jgi:hypothetical protein
VSNLSVPVCVYEFEQYPSGLGVVSVTPATCYGGGFERENTVGAASGVTVPTTFLEKESSGIAVGSATTAEVLVRRVTTVVPAGVQQVR